MMIHNNMFECKLQTQAQFLSFINHYSASHFYFPLFQKFARQELLADEA